MGLLDSIIKETKPRPPKGIIYADPGVGKTTFGASIPSSVIIDAENGCANIQATKTPYLETWLEIKQWLDELASGAHEYRCVVVDTLDWVLRRSEEFVVSLDKTQSGIAGTLNRSHGGYGNGKQALRNCIYQQVLPPLDKLVNRGVAVVLLAHTTQAEIQDADGIKSKKVAPDIHSNFMNVFVEWSDFVGCAKKSQGTRRLVMSEQPKILAKNRYGIEGEIDFTWPALVGAMTSKKEAK